MPYRLCPPCDRTSRRSAPSTALAAHPSQGPRPHERRSPGRSSPQSDGRSRSSRPLAPSRGRTAGDTARRPTVPRGPPRRRRPQGPAALTGARRALTHRPIELRCLPSDRCRQELQHLHVLRDRRAAHRPTRPRGDLRGAAPRSLLATSGDHRLAPKAEGLGDQHFDSSDSGRLGADSPTRVARDADHAPRTPRG